MPSTVHEVVVELLRDRRGLLELLLTRAGVEVPPHDAVSSVSENLGDALPRELRADGVLRLDHQGRAVLAVVIEVQLDVDGRKRFSWPAYLVGARIRGGCDALVIVVTADRAVAAWARAPIRLGPGSVVQPLVLGPDEVPELTDFDEAMKTPTLAALSAVVHSRHADPARAALIVATLHKLGALGVLKGSDLNVYIEVTYELLSKAAKKEFAMLTLPPDYEYKTPWLRELQKKAIAEGLAEGRATGIAEGRATGIAEGRATGLAEGRATGLAEGKAEALLAVLNARGLPVTDAQRARLAALTDLGELDRLLRAAVSARSVDELLSEG